MLIAAAEGPDGRKRLIVGLHQENVDALANDKPIYKRLDGKDTDETEGLRVPGLEEWDLVVLGPEDLERFRAHFAPAHA
jgi:hypothetical protein